jgi:hypothetical protein
LKWQGAWTDVTAYTVNDAVEYNGSSYLAIQAGSGHAPDVSPSFWSLLAQQGAPGSATAGSAGMAWQGTWSNTKAYAVNDAVECNGSSYISIQAGTAQSPDISPTYWSVLAQQGATGPQGPAGSAGAAGSIGPQGPAGLTGATGGQGPPGSAGMTWQGTWNNTKAYAVSDAVQYNGSSYISVQAGTAQPPDISPAYWSVLAQQGATGPQGPAGSAGSAGAIGPQGPAGLTGATGAQGPSGWAGMAWQGTWSNTKAYAVSDGVEYNGSSYISIQAGTGQPPDISPGYWSVIAQRGATGPQGPAGSAGAIGPQGPAGLTGATGATGAQGPAGPAGMTWQGTWSNTKAYAVNDAVEYNGSSYISVQAGTAQPPDISPGYWSALAQQGAAGPQGPAGSAGSAGAIGLQGPAGLTGATGVQGPAGPAGMTRQGAWSNTKAYAVNDAVQYNGSSYMSIQAGTGQPPDISPAYWSALATGVQSYTAASHQWINSIAANGAPSSSQPAFTDISGSVGPSQLPNPAPTTLGGVKSQAAVLHQWISSIGTNGQPATSQPADSDLLVSNNTANDVSSAAHGFAPRAPNSTAQWLRGDATWANAPGRLVSFAVITTVGASTYPTPANITAILVECVGGGGGGGGAAGVAAKAAAGGSGGSGSYSRKYISLPLASYPVSVGAGGSGGAAGNAGSSGNTTTFGGLITCNGGSGGGGGAAGTAVSIVAGGAGGAVSTGGDINIGGQAGGNGLRLSGAISGSAPGGASYLGGGAVGVLSAADVAAVNYGAGGSGASTQGAVPEAGGNGSQGVIVVWEFQ